MQKSDDSITRVTALKSRDLPRFTFVGDGGAEEAVALSGEVPRIREIARYIGRQTSEGTVVGLIFPSGKNLVINWLACLVAGFRPLIVQYPTKKQSHAYWRDSVTNTISVAGVGAIICDDHCADILEENFAGVPVVAQQALETLAGDDAAPFEFTTFSILQLSSGTTGHRKAVEFNSEQLFTHVADFNESLDLTHGDRIVSWLPLYHDMGYVACFVMPLLLGIDVVMMDPMSWVRTPNMLYDAIERHRGTVCYMPNFGFEVMARLESRKLDSMRWWISCSEPVSAQTARRFLDKTGAAPEAFAPCYAMAENVFAVSIRRGLKVDTIDQADVVSCGRPVRNVDVKVVDNQLWVRSPTSLKTYLGGASICDADGFYPTGDLGSIVEDEIYVTGRIQDLLIQAGRKYMLSDLDLELNRLFSWVKGRAAAVQIYDPRLGTQKPVVLIEATDFFERRDQGEIAQALKDAVGLDQIEIQFVPPRFLTKTSSGKFNRKKSAADWLLVLSAREGRRSDVIDSVAELRDSFEHADWSKPVAETLDSLSLEILRIILTGTHVAFDGQSTLQEFAERLAVRERRGENATPDTIRIVSLADRAIFRKLKEKHIDELSALLGAPVTFEHICLPPSPVILSDLIFHDYFQPRLDQSKFAAVNRAFEALKSASVIVVDDVAELLISATQVYAPLSHNLERDQAADFVVFRWQRYPQYHDELPLSFAAGRDLSLVNRTEALANLACYLHRPVFRIATVPGYSRYTQSWDYRPEDSTHAGKAGRLLNGTDFVSALSKWLLAREEPPQKFPASGAEKLQMNDLGHFCSHFVDKTAADKVIEAYDRFCIVGQRSSFPYLRKELERRGKGYVYARSYAADALGAISGDYECLVICGAQGEFNVDGPTVAMMRASKTWRTLNIENPEIASLQFQIPVKKYPETNVDWYYPFPLERGANSEISNEVNRASKAARKLAEVDLRRRKKKWRKLKAKKKAWSGRNTKAD